MERQRGSAHAVMVRAWVLPAPAHPTLNPKPLTLDPLHSKDDRGSTMLHRAVGGHLLVEDFVPGLLLRNLNSVTIMGILSTIGFPEYNSLN